MDRPEALCRVCGDKASGKHYGVASCDGCRGFFKRSIRRYRNKTLDYVCKENGACVVDVTRRNQCQACRFQKCLQVNMKKDAVQHERAPRSVQKRPLFGAELTSVGAGLGGNLLGPPVPSPMPALPPYYPGFFSPSAFKPGSLSPFLHPAPPLPPLTLTLSHNSAFRPSAKSPVVIGAPAPLPPPGSGESGLPPGLLGASVSHATSFMSSLTPTSVGASTVASATSFLQPYGGCGPFSGGLGFLYSSEAGQLSSQGKLIITPPTRPRNHAPCSVALPFSAESLAQPIREDLDEDSEPPQKRRRSGSASEAEVTSSGAPCVAPSPSPRAKDTTPEKETSPRDTVAASTAASLFLSSFKAGIEALHTSTPDLHPRSPVRYELASRRSANRPSTAIATTTTNNNNDGNNGSSPLAKPHQGGGPQRINTEASPSDAASPPTYSPSPPPTPASSPTEKVPALTLIQRDVKERSPTRSDDSPVPSANRCEAGVQEKPKGAAFLAKDDSPPPSEEGVPEGGDGVHENAARLLFLGVKWARSIPAFMQLSFRDQAILLEESWSELFLVSAAQWGLPVPETEATLAAQTAPIEVRLMRDLCSRFHNLSVDATEYACLKAIILFRPEARGLRDGRGVEALQDQTQLMFHEYLASKVGGACARVRVGKLLLLLPPLSHVSASAIQEIFFKRTVGDIPIERVLCDMFKSC